MNRNYELVLMLDPEVADEGREKVAGDVRQAIEAAGTLDQADTWGLREMAYEIKQRNEADYRFFRFQGEPPLLERLDHSLKITDGVLRFRIFKVDPEAPGNPPPPFERLVPSGDGRGDRERRPRRDRDE
jgi:small subunit ribosomal protein S6